jgi:glycosyltransferase involved in cell wall biosynthesis
MDGGSSDRSVEIIKSRADELHHWTSRPDRGPYHAIADGFATTDADIMGWIGSDDILLPWALRIVGGIFRDCPNVEWITTETPLNIGPDGLPHWTWRIPGFSKRGFRSRENSLGPNAPPFAATIQQESTFWRRTLWKKAGARFAADCKLAGDFELWDRFFEHAKLYSIDLPLGAFRHHGEIQKSVGSRAQYVEECEAVLARHGTNRVDAKAFLHRLARTAGLQLPALKASYESIHIIRRRADGSFMAMVV